MQRKKDIPMKHKKLTRKQKRILKNILVVVLLIIRQYEMTRRKQKK